MTWHPLGERVSREAEGCAAILVAKARASITERRGVVLVMAYALKAALDTLSPDERSAFVADITGWLK